MNIPFVDLKAQLKDIRNEIDAGIAAVLNKTNFILGEEVQEFEKNFAKFCGTQYAVGVDSGLDAIHLALRALGIGPGDEVIVPAHTFIASALGVTLTGATPVFVDIDEKTFLLDFEKTKKAVHSKTKAILPVHLYGRILDLEPFLSFAQSKGIAIVEDAAQSHGASIHQKKAGSFGVAGCFSFYPGKNLGCYGDGGLVTTDSLEVKTQLESLHNYGSPKKYHHPMIGFNSRLDTLQAAVLSVKLPHLDRYNQARYQAAEKYSEGLKSIGDLVLPELPPRASHVFHLYVIRTTRRDELLKHLNDSGIQAGIHYPVPIHLHGAYSHLEYQKGDFPIAEKICNEIISLPIFPEITDEQIRAVCDQIKKFFHA
jgi:dTDP-4-amino-4,6-dideoxygalactose transaminase